jgi:hypothetical protein
VKELERMIVDNSKRIEALDGDITSLKTDVGSLKVDMSKIGTTLEFQETRSKERFEALTCTQNKMIDIMRDKEKRDDEYAHEARQYRQRREELEAKANIERQKWFRSLVTPQTIMIMLFIVAAFLGIRLTDIHTVSSFVGGGSDSQKTQPEP